MRYELEDDEMALVIKPLYEANGEWEGDVATGVAMNETTLAGGYTNGEIYVWDIGTGTVVHVFTGHLHPAPYLKFHGAYVHSSDGVDLNVWTFTNGEIKYKQEP